MRFTKVNIKFCLVVALLAMTLFVTKPASTASATASALVCPGVGCVCFPSCPENDGKFLSIAGAGLATFVGGSIEIGIRSDPTLLDPTDANVAIGVFDPNATGLWDTPTVELLFELVADPNNDGTGTTIVDSWQTGDPDFPPGENIWVDVTVPNVDGGPAEGPGGTFSYFLRITPLGMPGADSLNAIKVRTDGVFSLTGQTIQFISPADEEAEFDIIGGFDFDTQACPTPTTYDGTWEFKFQVQPDTIAIELWDGDFDFGNTQPADGPPITNKDTNDPNTPPTGVCVDPDPVTPPNCIFPNVPLWSQSAGTNPEGIALSINGLGVGEPPDDNDFCAFRRSPISPGVNVIYSLISPTNVVYTNANPSGNSEWERFLISTKAADNPDHLVNSPTLATGQWTLRIEGMDVFNQFALHFNRFLEPTTGNAQGCSPGYWKQSQHFGSYPTSLGIYPSTLFKNVFLGANANLFGDMTLLQVLNQGGGGKNALGRIIVSAYLNAYIPGFPFLPGQVIADFAAVVPANYDTLKNKYEDLQDPCPLGLNPGPASAPK